MNLPKLRACPICGKEPEWYNGWYDIARAMGGLTVFCKCDKMYITPYPYSLDELIRDDNLVKTIVDDVARRWEKFCEKEAKKNENAMQESADAVRNSPRYDFSCVTELLDKEEEGKEEADE